MPTFDFQRLSVNYPLRIAMNRLRNRYFLLRHGESDANVECKIVSSPEIGRRAYGLTKRGRRQVEQILSSGALETVDAVYASDFLRTRQSAEIISTAFGIRLELSPSLRERFFGDWDGMSNQHYQDVWQRDRDDAYQTVGNVESVASVALRMSEFITEIEHRHFGHQIVLVSHGDPLQILLAAYDEIELGRHRDLPAVQTAEVRQLNSG